MEIASLSLAIPPLIVGIRKCARLLGEIRGQDAEDHVSGLITQCQLLAAALEYAQPLVAATQLQFVASEGVRAVDDMERLLAGWSVDTAGPARGRLSARGKARLVFHEGDLRLIVNRLDRCQRNIDTCLLMAQFNFVRNSGGDSAQTSLLLESRNAGNWPLTSRLPEGAERHSVLESEDGTIEFSFSTDAATDFSTRALYINERARISDSSVVFEFDRIIQSSKPYRRKQLGQDGTLKADSDPVKQVSASSLPNPPVEHDMEILDEKGMPPHVPVPRLTDEELEPLLERKDQHAELPTEEYNQAITMSQSTRVVKSKRILTRAAAGTMTSISGGGAAAITFSSIGRFLCLRPWTRKNMISNAAASEPSMPDELLFDADGTTRLYRIVILGASGSCMCEFVDKFHHGTVLVENHDCWEPARKRIVVDGVPAVVSIRHAAQVLPRTNWYMPSFLPSADGFLVMYNMNTAWTNSVFEDVRRHLRSISVAKTDAAQKKPSVALLVRHNMPIDFHTEPEKYADLVADDGRGIELYRGDEDYSFALSSGLPAESIMVASSLTNENVDDVFHALVRKHRLKELEWSKDTVGIQEVGGYNEWI